MLDRIKKYLVNDFGFQKNMKISIKINVALLINVVASR
jgi:hypothetical protein